MKCPHCSVAIRFEEEDSLTWPEHENDVIALGYQLAYGHCPNCENLIVLLQNGLVETKGNAFFMSELRSEELLYPRSGARPLPPEVCEPERSDFAEAVAVLPVSTKASAALSRRLLQHVLRERFKIKPSSLDKEIEDFLKLPGVPSHVMEAVDGVRNIGNFAAHPIKNTNTGEIVDVEPGEAEWLLEVLEALFDFTFTQPVRLQQRKDELNKKLATLGKPPMKG